MVEKARILAVDDQLYFRSFLEELLGEEGYAVETAASGPAAIAALERHPAFDIVISDLIMPGMDGIETVRRIRERWPEKPVIVVTGVGDVRSAVGAMKLGAAEYLLKPIDREELLRAVESVLERQRIRRENARLLDENLSYLGLLSVYERGLALLSRDNAHQIVAEWLDLCCLEAHLDGGAAWLRDRGDGELVRVAERGASEAALLPGRWQGPDAGWGSKLRTGEPVFVAGATPDGSLLWVPAARGGALIALARLRCPSAPGELVLASCRKLGDLAAQAIEAAERTQGLARGGLSDATTGLPTLGYLERVTRTEIHKAERFSRRLSLLCVRLDRLPGAPDAPLPADALEPLVKAIERSLRATDVLAFEPPDRFWVLVPEADPLGTVVLKRRIAARLREPVARLSLPVVPCVGGAAFPLDGDSYEALAGVAGERAGSERDGVLQALHIDESAALAAIGARLLERGVTLPARAVGEIAELCLGELACRPAERGLLFLAPGAEKPSLIGPLTSLAHGESATQVFLATDGDTLPTGVSVHAVPLPPDVSAEATWIVRVGEGPQYALVAAPADGHGNRQLFHSSERSLVEHLAFRLRAEVGFGMRA
jgi:CheY-like chemotaxis protein/GGDEF domain-containing protein